MPLRRKRKTFLAPVYEQVTAKIIGEIERGTKPWEVPWQGGDDWPRNAKSKRPYGGINVLILLSARSNLGFGSDRWLTAKQAERMGGRVRAGEKGTTVIFGGKNYQRTGREQIRAGRWIGKAQGFYRQYLIFNVEQCEGLPPPPRPPQILRDCSFPGIKQLIAATGVDLRIEGTRAFYHVELDYVQVPPCRLFFDPNNWPRTVCHELAHWTQPPCRLNRPPIKSSVGQAHEEILVELAASFMLQRLGICSSVNAADYIGEWFRFLDAGSPSAIWDIAVQAANVADYLLSFEKPLTHP